MICSFLYHFNVAFRAVIIDIRHEPLSDIHLTTPEKRFRIPGKRVAINAGDRKQPPHYASAPLIA